jgi:hypothetical protein
MRDAIIGAAPLITGSLFVAYAGFVHLGFSAAWQQLISGDLSSISAVLSAAIDRADFWIWFYFIFVVSSTIFPSASDRRAWRPIVFLLGLLIALLLISGAGPWLWENFGQSLLGMVDILSLIFLLSALVHLVLWPPCFFIRIILERIFNLRVV